MVVEDRRGSCCCGAIERPLSSPFPGYSNIIILPSFPLFPFPTDELPLSQKIWQSGNCVILNNHKKIYFFPLVIFSFSPLIRTLSLLF